MIELTPEHRQAVDRGESVRVVDPATRETYLLIREEVFSRQSDVRLPPSHDPPPDIDPRLLRCMKAFWRDLPELLQDRRNRGKWAAYHGDERVGVGKTQAEVYQECYRRGAEIRGLLCRLRRGRTRRHPALRDVRGRREAVRVRDAGVVKTG